MKLKISVLSLYLCVLAELVLAQQPATPPASTSSSSTTSTSNYGLPKKQDFDQWSVGLNGGVNWFQGDLQDNSAKFGDYLKNPVIGLKIGYQMTHSFQFNLRGYYTRLAGHEDDVAMRLPDPVDGDRVDVHGASFKTNVIQGTINMNYTIGNISFVQRNKRVHLFAEVGAGVFNFKPKLTGFAVDP